MTFTLTMANNENNNNNTFKLNKINKLQINVASSEKIKNWSKRDQIIEIKLNLSGVIRVFKIKKSIFGEVTCPSLFQDNNNPIKYHKDGLFSEMIFGPKFNFKCLCNKQLLKVDLFKDCKECNITFTLTKIRNYRLGYIPLILPVFNPLFLLNNVNLLKIIFGSKEKFLIDSIYFNCSKQNQSIYIKNLTDLLKISDSISNAIKGGTQHVTELNYLNLKFNRKTNLLDTDLQEGKVKNILNKHLFLFHQNYRKIKIADYFNEKLFKFLDSFDVLKELNFINQKFYKVKKISSLYRYLSKKVRVLENFYKTQTKLSSIMLKALPVTPPNFRPYDPEDVDGSNSSKLNYLYQNILSINERLCNINTLNIFNKKYFVLNEIRILQEAIDFLIDNNKIEKNKFINTRPSNSLVEILKGKEGRFRKDILGKRINFSARSVIVVNPLLKLTHCAVPLKILKNLLSFKLVKVLNKLDITVFSKVADINMIYLSILKKLVKHEIIMLNRAPTLHKLGIQSFNVLITGSDAIQLHPLVCSAYNADFDGDQMAVYLPLTKISQVELNLMLKSTKDLFLFGNSSLKMKPTQELILGLNYLGQENNLIKSFSFGNYFSNYNEFFVCFIQKKLRVHDAVWVKTNSLNCVKFETQLINNNFVRMTPGRLIINKIISEKSF